MTENPLLSDRDVDFLLYDVLHAEELCALPAFHDHSRETFDPYIQGARRFARDVLYPAYRPMDESPARLESGGVVTHARMKEIWPQMVGLGVISATRPTGVGGASLPLTVATMANAYLMASNLSAYGYAGLTTGAAHLLEAFANDALKTEYMMRLYSGEWTGTMALTEPHAGSSLSDVATRATPRDDGAYSIVGSKIFISGGDHDLTDNLLHMVLARIDGAPSGIKGVSLFAVPKKRNENGALVPNDVHVTGLIHKIGWRGLPSLALGFGDNGDCRGHLVGEPNKGISYMFQMMNEARIMVGLNGVSTAQVAYHESLAYARMRPQGRALVSKDPARPQIPILEHADVRRMLLRQKAICEGGLHLVAFTAKQADLAENATEADAKKRAALFLDLLTPVTKSFPAEWGFESNALALQIHGGYGYSSEQLPESWLRDQKLNSIHEGTTGIHGLDLLGRKVVAQGGEPLRILLDEIEKTAALALAAGVDPAWVAQVRNAAQETAGLVMHLGALGMGGDVDGMMRHSAHFLMLFSILVVSWLWLWQAQIARGRLANPSTSASDTAFYEGKLCAAQYWIATELPRVHELAMLCRSNDDSYSRMQDAWF